MKREDLAKLRLKNREDKVIYNLLGTIIGECDRVGKDLLRDQIAKILEKTVKSIEATKEYVKEGDLEVMEKEINFIKELLPKKLTEEEMMFIVGAILKDRKGITMKEIMEYFKLNYPGQYEGKLLSRLVKNYLV